MHFIRSETTRGKRVNVADLRSHGYNSCKEKGVNLSINSEKFAASEPQFPIGIWLLPSESINYEAPKGIFIFCLTLCSGYHTKELRTAPYATLNGPDGDRPGITVLLFCRVFKELLPNKHENRSRGARFARHFWAESSK